MDGLSARMRRSRCHGWAALAVVFVILGEVSPTRAQTGESAIPTTLLPIPFGEELRPAPAENTASFLNQMAPVGDTSPSTSEVVPVSCQSCGSGPLGPPGPAALGWGGCSSCGSWGCYPGRKPCASPCEGKTFVGRFLCGLYHCICCPDPCYDPQWLAKADAAFFVEAARPVNQQRLRWEAGLKMEFPDRAEYFWARADGRGKGPRPRAPFRGETQLNYNEMSMYTEAATGNAAFFIEMPYRSLDPDLAPHAAGLGDMNLGTKSLLFDCELLQIAFQSRIYMPMGQFLKGLGTGHVSLQPALLVGLNLGPNSFMQCQVAEWIPLGGDPSYAGAILHYHTSLNHVWWRPLADVQLIGTLEFNGWSFQDGAFTDPFRGSLQKASRESYFSMGPGFRLVICDKIDFGVGTAFAVSEHHWAERMLRSEFRWRF